MSTNGSRHRACLSYLVAASVALCHAPALAQVNVEVLRRDLAEAGVGGRMSASWSTSVGNTEKTQLGGAGLVGARQGRHLVYLSLNGEFSSADGEVDAENAFAHLRYNLTLYDRLWAEVFAQAEHDQFRRIKVRRLLGIGPRVAVIRAERASLYYGTSYMLEATDLEESDASEEPIRPNLVHRFNHYAAGVFELEPKRAIVSNTIYFQPRFDDFSDYRLLNVLSLDFNVSGLLTAGVHLTARYETPTPADVKRGDLSVTNSLGLRF